MKIKFIIYLLLSLTTMSTLCLTRDEALSQWNECLNNLKISKEALEDLKKRKNVQYDCFNACVMKRRGTMVNGKIDADKLIATLKKFNLINQSRTEDQLRKCATIANKEGNDCAVAKNMLDCFFVK